jgi:hypothetical protein
MFLTIRQDAISTGFVTFNAMPKGERTLSEITATCAAHRASGIENKHASHLYKTGALV